MPINKYYTTVKSNQLLKDRFYGSPLMLNLINSLSAINKCVFAALCDGYRVTTAGYVVPADMKVNRASAIIHALRELNLPIRTAFLQAISDAGNETRQAIFFIERSDILRLSSEPEKVLKEYQQKREEIKLRQAKNDIKRLYQIVGKEGLLVMINEIELSDGGK